jgi:hypothetical protein
MISVNRNNYSTIWASDQSNSATFLDVGTTTDGITMHVFNNGIGGAPIVGSSLVVGLWHRVAFSLDAGGTGILYQGADTGSLTTFSKSGFAAVTSPSLYIGSDSFADLFNGRVANFKHYSTVLTAAEIQAELAQYLPVRTDSLVRWHPFLTASTVDYSGNARTLSGGTGASTEDGPPIRWGSNRRALVTSTPVQPTVDAGKDIFGTAGFEFSVQAVESGSGITDRSWTVVSGPAEVASEIGTTSLLSWFPATPGVYELEYRVINPAGQAYDTVFATVNATGTIVNSASVTGTANTVTCSKPSGVAAGDVMLAVQAGDFNDHDLMTSPNAWQPLFEHDAGFDSLHVKGWTLTAGDSEPASYDFTQGTGSAGVITIVAMRGVVEAGVRYEITPDASTGATRTCPTVEGAVPGSILLCGAMADPGAARSWTPPTGMTEQSDAQSSTGTTQSVASLLDPGDPTGTKSFTLSGTTTAPGGIQWSAVFPMPPDPQRRGANKSMFTVVRTS